MSDVGCAYPPEATPTNAARVKTTSFPFITGNIVLNHGAVSGYSDPSVAFGTAAIPNYMQLRCRLPAARRITALPTHQLKARPVERVWGVRELPYDWVEATGQPIGEVWFEDDSDREAELLVKFLFTSDRLSVQVHPDDSAARACGYPRGKDEAWLVLEAMPGAVIGLGLTQVTSPEALKAAACDGGIAQLVHWHPVDAGDFFYSPAGTVHAIGAGLILIEIQQNLDLTYRLYDFGRPRELHLDAGIRVAHPRPWSSTFVPRQLGPGRLLLHAGGAFVTERWTGESPRIIEAGDAPVLVIPTRDGGHLDDAPLQFGTVARIDGDARIEGDCDVVAAYSGEVPRSQLISRPTLPKRVDGFPNTLSIAPRHD